MNLEESNEFIKHQDKRNKKKFIVICAIVICIVIIVLLSVVMASLKIKDANTVKLYVNGEKVELTNTLFVTQDDISYVSVKEFAGYAGYKFENGEYKKYTEDDEYCYLKSDYEAVSMAVGKDYVKKYLISNNSDDSKKENKNNSTNSNNIVYEVQSQNDTMQIYELDSEIIKINNQIYCPLKNISKVFNVRYVVDDKDIKIYNLNYLYRVGMQKANGFNYSSVSNCYENVRALSDGMLVVCDNSGKFGVVSLIDGNTILGVKHDSILYLQNTEEFFVYDDDTVGLLDKSGKEIIKPKTYDSLIVFDEINKLYLAQRKGVYGIISRNGNELIKTAFDEIGISKLKDYDYIADQSSDTPNLLDSKFIVVSDNEKKGLYDLEGNLLIKSIYDQFGYLADEKDKKENKESVLITPKEIGLYGLVVRQNDLYGIYDLKNNNLILPCSFTKIYSKTESGEVNYYIEMNDEIYNLKELLEENGIYYEPDDEDNNDDDWDYINTKEKDDVEENDDDKEEIEENKDKEENQKIEDDEKKSEEEEQGNSDDLKDEDSEQEESNDSEESNNSDEEDE